VTTAPTLRFLGGTGTVTGSKFLIESGGRRVLVDCGLFQGERELRRRNRADFPVDPASIDAVVLTHAHLDHTGYLPALARDGFAGPVFCTPGTARLARIVLEDSARLQEEEARFANRTGYSKHHPALPLYTVADAQAAERQFEAVPFETRQQVAPGVTVELRPAGHILGSATACLALERGRTVLFTGDLGRPHHPLLRPPADPPAVDVLVSESTYGARRHGDDGAAVAHLADVIRRTAARGGMIIVPAFAVDRTEVVLLALARLFRDGAVPRLPIYADSPMALAVLGVYRSAIAGGDPEIRSDVRADAFDLGGELLEVLTQDESRRLNDLHFPSIVISSSGMATGGRVLHHLEHRLGDERNAVVLVGFQAPGTRGHSLAEGARTVKLFGHYLPVRAEVVTIDGFSVHADAHELTAWLGRAPRPPEVTFLVHGEPAASEALRDRIASELGWTAVVPRLDERVRLD
jgi:metallo-beta-lactamase family protein